MMRFFIVAIAIALLGLFSYVNASSHILDLRDPFGSCDWLCVTNNIIRGIFWISVPIVSIMVLIGAFQLIVAAGDEKKISSAKKTILYATIGFLVATIASGIVPIIRGILGV